MIMKKFNKLFTLLLAAAMVLAMSVSVFAAAGTPATGTITITPPENATGENTYKIYKVFDATVNADTGAVAYKLLDGCADTDVPDGFEAERGYITKAPDSLDETASALAAYDKKILADTVTTNGTTASASKELEPGYYYIETSTGAAVYVNAGGNIQVKDKNVIPTVKKSPGTEYDANSLAAIAAVGTDQPYTAVINAGKGAKNVKFSDTMTNQTYNGDAKVYVGESQVTAGDNTFSISGAAGDASFSITFADAYIASLDPNTEITIKYSGKITSAALSNSPATNKATVTSGENNTNSSEEIKVYNAKVTVNKVDDNEAPLPGAKFKLKNNATGLYYAGATTDGEANWTEAGVEVEAVSVDGAYTAEFVGLGAGTYTLEESTVPEGYNKAKNETITVSADGFTSTNLEQSRTVVNQSGAELPSTGGIGTVIFYVLGSLLVIGAGIVLVARRRMNAN
jgi:LPXTG-motif cell wall-anchored protein